MLYDLVFPSSPKELQETACIIAASVFDKNELKSFGVADTAYDFNPAFCDMNEFDKLFALWSSPAYLVDFYEENASYFEDEYWTGITVTRFVFDVRKSVPHIKRSFQQAIESRTVSEIAIPLEGSDEQMRSYKSIRIKFKEGSILNRFAFRIYAIEVEENKCYVITGGTIKIVWAMKEAENTRVELRKIHFVYHELQSNHIDTKETFVEYLLK